MELVVVLPGERSDAFAARLAALLRGRLPGSLITRDECAVCTTAELWVIAAHRGQRLELGVGCILVCLEECAETILARNAQLLIGEGLSVPKGVLASQIISLGPGSKNTVTVSSLQSGRAMISLQRTIFSLDGDAIEPCEYSIDLPDGAGLPETLTAAVLLLLCGAEPKAFGTV